jgi:hypothetical protein
VLWGDDEELDLLQNKIGERVREVRRVRDDGGRPEGDGGFTGRCRNQPWLPADMRGSGEKFRRPGGAIGRRKKGERIEGGGLLIGAGAGTKRQALK